MGRHRPLPEFSQLWERQRRKEKEGTEGSSVAFLRIAQRVEEFVGAFLEPTLACG